MWTKVEHTGNICNWHRIVARLEPDRRAACRGQCQAPYSEKLHGTPKVRGALQTQWADLSGPLSTMGPTSGRPSPGVHVFWPRCPGALLHGRRRVWIRSEQWPTTSSAERGSYDQDHFSQDHRGGILHRRVSHHRPGHTVSVASRGPPTINSPSAGSLRGTGHFLALANKHDRRTAFAAAALSGY